MKYRTSIIQNDIYHKDINKNLSKMKKLLNTSLKNKPNIIVLPETWTTGFSEEVFLNADNLAEEENGRAVQMLKEFSDQNNVWIVGGTILEKTKEGIYNTTYLIDNNGKIKEKYRKIHLFSPFSEDKGILSGNKIKTVSTDLGTVGLMTCYDIRYPEMARIISLEGADIIFVVANFKTSLDHWKTLLKARAIENQVFIVASNRVGNNYPDEKNCFGHSIIINPWGEIIAEADDKEEIIFGDINYDVINEVKEKSPVFKDRKKECYKYIFK